MLFVLSCSSLWLLLLFFFHVFHLLGHAWFFILFCLRCFLLFFLVVIYSFFVSLELFSSSLGYIFFFFFYMIIYFPSCLYCALSPSSSSSTFFLCFVIFPCSYLYCYSTALSSSVPFLLCSYIIHMPQTAFYLIPSHLIQTPLHPPTQTPYTLCNLTLLSTLGLFSSCSWCPACCGWWWWACSLSEPTHTPSYVTHSTRSPTSPPSLTSSTTPEWCTRTDPSSPTSFTPAEKSNSTWETC